MTKKKKNGPGAGGLRPPLFSLPPIRPLKRGDKWPVVTTKYLGPYTRTAYRDQAGHRVVLVARWWQRPLKPGQYYELPDTVVRVDDYVHSKKQTHGTSKGKIRINKKTGSTEHLGWSGAVGLAGSNPYRPSYSTKKKRKGEYRWKNK